MTMMVMTLEWLCLLSLCCYKAQAWIPSGGLESMSRHDFMISLSSSLLVSVAPVSPTSSTRDVDVGGGFDMLAEPQLASKDVLYPPSMEGLWNCERVVTVAEGDSFAAETIWKALGGGHKKLQEPESYLTKFIRSSLISDDFVVLDRGYDVSSRKGASNVVWSVDQPSQLTFDKIELTVLRRVVEAPSDKGWGCQELVRIKDGPFMRAAFIKRRYRRSYDETGINRVVEGLEIVKTFRVLDGVAGTEFPTSTTKSTIRMSRPPSS